MISFYIPHNLIKISITDRNIVKSIRWYTAHAFWITLYILHSYIVQYLVYTQLPIAYTLCLCLFYSCTIVYNFITLLKIILFFKIIKFDTFLSFSRSIYRILLTNYRLERTRIMTLSKDFPMCEIWLPGRHKVRLECFLHYHSAERSHHYFQVLFNDQEVLNIQMEYHLRIYIMSKGCKKCLMVKNKN